MKTKLKLLGVLMLLIATAFTASAYDFEVDGIYYNKTSGAEVEVTSGDSIYSGSVTIPTSVTYSGTTYWVTSIGERAFEWCVDLTSVTIPNSVTEIGDWAFCVCSGLTSVTIPNSVTKIGDYAFEECIGLTSVTIPNSVTSIGNWAFAWCSDLTSVTIGNSVTEIGAYAFISCSDLTSVTIGNSVTSIGNNAFDGCDGLTAVHITDLAAWCKIEFANEYANPLFDADNLYLNGEKVTNLVIPNSVTSIGDYAFICCYGLTSVTIGNSVTEIGNLAFWLCSGLTSVTIPNSVTSIGNSAFAACHGLTSVTIPNSVTSIGDYAFWLCRGLTSVTIGNSVTSIGSNAFQDCGGLTSFTSFAAVPPTCGNQAFEGINKSECVLHVPAESISAYKAADPWKEFFNMEEMQGVDDVIADEASGEVVGYYNLQGVRSDEPWDGLNIVVYSDGTRRKIRY